MICQNCGHEQASGKFCGKCGQEMLAARVDNVDEEVKASEEVAATEANQTSSQPNYQQSQAAQQPQQAQQPNPQVEQLKKQSKLYWGYFVDTLKSPDKSFASSEDNFINALINIGVFALLFPIILFVAAKDLYIFDFIDMSYLTATIYLVFFVLVLMGVSYASLIAVNKIMDSAYSPKDLLMVYSAHTSRSILVFAASLLLMILKSYAIGMSLLTLGLAFTVMVVPLYLVSIMVSKERKRLDPFDGYIIYLVISTVLFLIIVTVFADSVIGNLLGEITNFPNFSNF